MHEFPKMSVYNKLIQSCRSFIRYVKDVSLAVDILIFKLL